MKATAQPIPQACESCWADHATTNCTDLHPICAACCAEFQGHIGLTEAQAVAGGYAPAPEA